MGDERSCENVIALRVVDSQDGMTANWVPLAPNSLRVSPTASATKSAVSTAWCMTSPPNPPRRLSGSRALHCPEPLTNEQGYSLKEIVVVVCRVTGIRVEDLRKISKDSRIQETRELLMYVARRYSGASLKRNGAASGSARHLDSESYN
jgi:hypothetical protein